jgi:hypothetical protein
MSIESDGKKTSGIAKLRITDTQFALLVTTAFAVITLVGLYYHEMWRDEFQAWQVAKFSPDLKTFYENQKIESGHLVLWNIILYVISHFLGGIRWEQVVHTVISCSSVFVLTRYAPFSRMQKILIPFGYFFLFEYNIIAREYSLTVLLVLLIAYHIHKAPGKLVLLGILLGLLIQINYYSIVFAIGFSLIIMRNLLLERKQNHFSRKQKSGLAVGAAILSVSVVCAIVQILHGYNDRVTKQLSGNARFFNDHVSDTLTRALSAFIPVPFFDSVNVWNHFIIEYFSVGLRLLLFVLILASILWMLRKQKDILLFFLVCGGVFIAFAYQSIYGYARHQGHIYILLIAALWMNSARAGQEKRRKALLNTLAGYALAFVFSIQVITSGIFYYKEITYPFSNIPAMAKFVESNKLTRYYICGYFDYSTSPLSAYTYKPVYFPQSKSEAYFIDWSKSKPRLTTEEILGDISRQLVQRDSLIFISTSPLEKPTAEFMAQSPISMNLSFLHACNEQCIVKDELYYFYKVARIKH